MSLMDLKALSQLLQICQHDAEHFLACVPKIFENKNSLHHDAAQTGGWGVKKVSNKCDKSMCCNITCATVNGKSSICADPKNSINTDGYFFQ